MEELELQIVSETALLYFPNLLQHVRNKYAPFLLFIIFPSDEGIDENSLGGGDNTV